VKSSIIDKKKGVVKNSIRYSNVETLGNVTSDYRESEIMRMSDYEPIVIAQRKEYFMMT